MEKRKKALFRHFVKGRTLNIPTHTKKFRKRIKYKMNNIWFTIAWCSIIHVALYCMWLDRSAMLCLLQSVRVKFNDTIQLLSIVFDQFDLYRLFTPIKPSLCWNSPFISFLFFQKPMQSKNRIHWTYSERPQTRGYTR